jgi:hypothetical protein
MSSIDIHATITKPIDELENDIFFSLDKEQLQDFICSLDEKSGSVDFTLQLIKRLVGGLVNYYEFAIFSSGVKIPDEKYKEEYEGLKVIQSKLESIR